MLINFVKNTAIVEVGKMRVASIRKYSFNRVMIAKFCISDTLKGTNAQNNRNLYVFPFVQ